MKSKIHVALGLTTILAVTWLGFRYDAESLNQRDTGTIRRPLNGAARQPQARRPTVAELRNTSADSIAALLKGLSSTDLRILFIELGKTDFDWALELASSTRHPSVYKGLALFGYTRVDPQNALIWARGQRSGPNVGFHIENRFMRDWAAGLFARSPVDFTATVLTLTSDAERLDVAQGLLHYGAVTRDYVSIFQSSDAIAFVAERIDRRFLLGLASDWARAQPESFLRYAAEASESHPLRAELLVAATGAFSAVDPAAALDWALSAKSDMAANLTKTAIQAWVLAADEPLSVVKRVREHSRATQVDVDTALRFASARVGRSSYERAFEVAAEIQDPATRMVALGDISLAWKGHPRYERYLRLMGAQ